MLALVADPEAAARLALRELPDPVPRADEALVAVAAVSLNRGEVGDLQGRLPGTVPGWDVAGTVRTAAADGSGPPQGARVAGLMPVVGGGWAQLAAVCTATLAELPDGVGFEAAAALPVAGLTALGALGVGSPLLGRRVAITGAAGGVGRLAVQLARRGGAHVTAVVGSPARGAGLAQLGADDVTLGLAGDGEPFDAVLESVGGALATTALRRLAPRGVLVSYGNASRTSAQLDLGAFHTRAAGASVYGFMVFEEVRRARLGAGELAALASLVAGGALDPHIDLVASWREPDAALRALLERRIAGKAVLVVD